VSHAKAPSGSDAVAAATRGCRHVAQRGPQHSQGSVHAPLLSSYADLIAILRRRARSQVTQFALHVGVAAGVVRYHLAVG
jgi:hypothetical protein